MRIYNNALRQRQAEQTRTTILEAVRDLLIDAPRSLSIPEIATKSSVSEPTIYRHFANRDALFEAASELLSSQPEFQMAVELSELVSGITSSRTHSGWGYPASPSHPTALKPRVGGPGSRRCLSLTCAQ